MDKTRREKVAYAKQAYKSGTKTVAELQKAVKKKFGSGISFRDIGQVFPASSRKKSAARKAKAARKRGPGRPKSSHGKPAARRGRPPASQAEHFILFVGDEAEPFASLGRVERRVAELLDEGHAPGDLAVYEKRNVKVSVTHRI